MDVEKSSRAPIAFRQSCRAAFLTILVISSPVTVPTVALGYLSLDRAIQTFVGVGLAGCAIFSVVRWLNRRHDPRAAKRPPDAS
jgi:hypothetical protein